MLNYYRDKKEGMYLSGEGGEGPAMRLRILRYYWEGGREQCEDNNWDGKKDKKNCGAKYASTPIR